MNTREELRKLCIGICAELEGLAPTGFYDEERDADCFVNVLGGSYYIGLDGEFHGVRLLIAFGGPTIYIDTLHMAVEGYWGRDEWNEPLGTSVADDINTYWANCYHMVKGA